EAFRRSSILPWPAGSSGAGNLSFRVIVDAFDTIAENNPQGTADDNNELVHRLANGPDLRIANLRVQPDPPAAGEELTILWEDSNSGGVATTSGWSNRLLLRNLDTGESLADLVLPDEARLARHDPIAAGSSRPRSHTLRLPDGVRGSGRIELSVAIDEDASGQGTVFETNGSGDAEANNRARIVINSLAIDYADLRPVSLRVPGTAWSGESIVVDWQVLNQGNAVTDRNEWNDRLLLSQDRLPSSDDIVLAAAVPHAGALSANDSYGGSSTVSLPRDLAGEYFVLLQVDVGGSVDEAAARDQRRLENNLLASSDRLRVELSPTPDLIPGDLTAPATLRPG
ncbi:MAG TPA: hypothetical protein DCY47_03685, partial [Candidatus Accumulibacter sp.]|nr:hypothetical protein [Accumulibacter sp.]